MGSKRVEAGVCAVLIAASSVVLFAPRSAQAVCGDGVTDPGEACDGADLNGYGCTSLLAGFAAGTLACKPDCSGYDVTQCTRGGTVTATSCAQAAVQAAIDAAAEGDTVLVPAGRCTWSVPVNVGRVATWTPVTYESRNVLIRGAGIGRTTIVSETGEGYDQRPFWIVCQEGKPFRITGFTFTNMKRRGSTEPAINVGGACRNWRIDHSSFDVGAIAPGDQGRGIIVDDFMPGLVDHNTFLDTYQGILVMGDGAASYERPLALGTEQAVYVEDNVFDYADDYAGDGANDASNGARYVFRYNRLRNAHIGHHGCDSGGHRSTHSFEIYANTIEWTMDQWWYASRYRDGTGVVYDNVLSGTLHDLSFGVVNYRTCCCDWCTSVDPAAPGWPCEPFTTCVEPLHTNCSEWGRCDGDNPLDGNLDATGWPCLDQTGRSTDEDGDTIQDLQPLYEWNNTMNGVDADITVNDPWGCTGPSMADHLQEGRDFINDTPRPGYVAYPYPHPLAQEADPWPEVDGGTDGGPPVPGGGCGCTTAGDARAGWLALLLVAGMARVARRRR
jgi:MYXO-CTERM domain-containing protein